MGEARLQARFGHSVPASGGGSGGRPVPFAFWGMSFSDVATRGEKMTASGGVSLLVLLLVEVLEIALFLQRGQLGEQARGEFVGAALLGMMAVREIAIVQP